MNVATYPKLEDLKLVHDEPTFEEMAEAVHEMLGKEINGAVFTVWPWSEGQIPTLEDVKCIYEERKVMLTGHYLQVCLMTGRSVPFKYGDHIKRLVDPVGYQKYVDETEFLVKTSFELFLSTNPTLEEAINKLIELSGDYWQERITPADAEKQIKANYPAHNFRGKVVFS